MVETDIGSLEEYITLDEAAMTLARMRMHRTVRNAPKEFLMRFFDTGWTSMNKCSARDYLPPRRQWVRPGPKYRGKKNTGQLQVASIMRCVRAHERAGALATTEWGGRLVRLVADVRRRVMECNISIAAPSPGKVPKLTVSGRRETRDISIFNDPADVVLLARTAAYLRDWFEPVLKVGRCCYSFRKSRKLTHQSAVGALCRWRKRHNGEAMFVAECDIKKFFDNIRHDEILKAFDRYAAQLGNLDPAVREVVCAYLRCYRVGETDGVSFGIPQGGSLSPVLANMVMAQADEAVNRFASPNLFYARYCDDMVIVASDEALCRRAMDAYFAALERLHLPPHPVVDFVYGVEYFEAKSKGPFRWCAAEQGTPGCAPWVSFLGNQMRFDGAVRVRKDTVRKHVLKIKEEVGSAIRLWERLGGKLRAGVGKTSFYKAFRLRIVAKGVGYMRAGPIPKDGICWAAAFPNLTNNAACERQMRSLDFARERALGAIRRVLGLKANRHPGYPGSYCGYLRKLKRIWKERRRLVARLPYSEL